MDHVQKIFADEDDNVVTSARPLTDLDDAPTWTGDDGAAEAVDLSSVSDEALAEEFARRFMPNEIVYRDECFASAWPATDGSWRSKTDGVRDCQPASSACGAILRAKRLSEGK